MNGAPENPSQCWRRKDSRAPPQQQQLQWDDAVQVIGTWSETLRNYSVLWIVEARMDGVWGLQCVELEMFDSYRQSPSGMNMKPCHHHRIMQVTSVGGLKQLGIVDDNKRGTKGWKVVGSLGVLLCCDSLTFDSWMFQFSPFPRDGDRGRTECQTTF